jgi:hypothetical protein
LVLVVQFKQQEQEDSQVTTLYFKPLHQLAVVAVVVLHLAQVAMVVLVAVVYQQVLLVVAVQQVRVSLVVQHQQQHQVTQLVAVVVLAQLVFPQRTHLQTVETVVQVLPHQSRVLL